MRGPFLVIAVWLVVAACSSSSSSGQGGTDTRKMLGEACDSDLCEAGLTCKLTCTKYCTEDTDCPRSPSGALSYCDISSCRPSCTTDADCPHYRCNTERGLATSYCTASPPLEPQRELAAGEPCQTGERCESSLGCLQGYCAEACETDDDCSAANGHAFDGGCWSSGIGDGRFCALGCSTTSDCPLGAACLSANSPARNELPLCVASSSVPGANGKILGESCQAAEECEGRLCDGICMRRCYDGDDCHLDYTSTHVDGECVVLPGVVEPTDADFVCVVGCDDDHPCAPGSYCEYWTTTRGVQRVCLPGSAP